MVIVPCEITVAWALDFENASAEVTEVAGRKGRRNRLFDGYD